MAGTAYRPGPDPRGLRTSAFFEELSKTAGVLGGITKALKRQFYGTVGMRAGAYPHLFRAGEQTLPEMIGSLARRPGEAFRGGAKGMSGLDRLFVGLSAAEAAHGVAKGRPKGESIGGFLGATLPWVVASRIPVLPNLALSVAGEQVGRRLGKLVGRREAKKVVPT